MKQVAYTCKARVWVYPGKSGWFFASLPEKESRAIKNSVSVRRPWGTIPVQVTLGSSTWNTSLFPDAKTGAYLLPLKAQIRKKEVVKDGGSVSLTIVVG